MATWIAPLDTETDPDAPLLSSLGKRWDNNVIAAFEGDVGAPHSAASWHPYDGVTVGDGNDGLIYDHAVDGDVASVVTPNFENGYEYRFFGVGVSVSSLSSDMQMDVYMETDAAWANVLDTPDMGALGVYISFDITVNTPRRASEHHFFGGALGYDGSTSSPIAVLYDLPVQKILRARFRPRLGTISNGKIYMQRRKVDDGT